MALYNWIYPIDSSEQNKNIFFLLLLLLLHYLLYMEKFLLARAWFVMFHLMVTQIDTHISIHVTIYSLLCLHQLNSRIRFFLFFIFIFQFNCLNSEHWSEKFSLRIPEFIIIPTENRNKSNKINWHFAGGFLFLASRDILLYIFYCCQFYMIYEQKQWIAFPYLVLLLIITTIQLKIVHHNIFFICHRL